jgi:hypothetical protein
MALSFKHAFQSAKGDPEDDTLVRPSNWNEEHSVSLKANALIGRKDDGDGDAEEVDCTEFARAVLNCSDAGTLRDLLGINGTTFSTGDVKFTLKDEVDDGWVFMHNQTIGKAGSGADQEDNDFQALFELIWNKFDDDAAPVDGGGHRGANSLADWNAGKEIALLRATGRALAVAGPSDDFENTFNHGDRDGAFDQTLDDANQLPPHTHTGTTAGQSADHYHIENTVAAGGSSTRTPVNNGSGASYAAGNTPTQGTSNDHVHGFETDSTGDSAGFSILSPVMYLNVMIKM